MKIFRVSPDVNNFQSLLLEDESLYDQMRFICKPKLPIWEPPAVFSDAPLLAVGDFWDFCSGAFAIVPCALEWLRDIVTPVGELLPLPYEGQMFIVLNVLPAVDCLDRMRSKFRRKNCFFDIAEYTFFSNRLPQISIFKIPETISEIYAVERTGDPKTEFKAAVEHHGLTGLIFKQIWEG